MLLSSHPRETLSRLEAWVPSVVVAPGAREPSLVPGVTAGFYLEEQHADGGVARERHEVLAAVHFTMPSTGRCGRASCICVEKEFHHVRPRLPDG